MTDDYHALAAAIQRVGTALHRLGTNDAATPMGAIELLSCEVKEGSERIADSLDAIANSITELADAVKERQKK